MIYFIIFLATLIYIILIDGILDWTSSVIKPYGERTLKDYILVLLVYMLSFPYYIIMGSVFEFMRYNQNLNLFYKEIKQIIEHRHK